VRAFARVAAAGALAACVTTYEDAPLFPTGAFGKREGVDRSGLVPATSIAIPIEGLSNDPAREQLVAFSTSLLRDMQSAVKCGDLDQLEGLLANYERADLPPSVRERVQGYRAVADGMRFVRGAMLRAKIVLEPPDAAASPAVPVEAGAPALGAPLHLVLELPAGRDDVWIGGRDDEDSFGFLVAVTVEDSFLDGSTHSSRTHEYVRLPAAVELRGDTVLRLPIEVELPGGNAARRDVHARVDLMPGYVRTAAGRCPVRSEVVKDQRGQLQSNVPIASTVVTQWPVGYGVLAAAPLAELRAALRVFEPKLFARAYLAAAATRGPDREVAIDLLIEQVRFGRPDQAQVAMAALRAVTGQPFLVGDREAWLAWSHTRR
jgi:hypothetical protein